MLWMTDTEKGITFVNKTWLDFTGHTLDEELGTGWVAGVHPDDLQRCFEKFSAAFDARRSFQTEIRLRRADGEFRSILYSGVPRCVPGGTFAGLHRLRRRHHRPAERRAFPAAGGEHRPGFLDVRHRQAGATVRQPGL